MRRAELAFVGVVHLILLLVGCHSTATFKSDLAGAWAYTDSKEIYSTTDEDAYIREKDYSKYTMIAGGEVPGEELAIIVRQDGSFDLTRTMYAMLGPGIEGLRNVGDEMTVHNPHSSATGRVLVERSEYTAKRSLISLRFDVEHVNCRAVLLEAELRQGEVVFFRYIERYDPHAQHGVIEYGLIAELRRYNGKRL